ncbi:MAG TPA: pantoate--beta-alanine ligase [Streptosporangiaceae bacterium]|nr:pantoate--beta-alanine ligase [Streptosporangiaceae bacterium]
MAAARSRLRSPVVLVPTLGALHDGHRALLRRGRELAGPDGALVVSIFVNPLQFGPGTDLDRYPRDLDRDLEICGSHGVSTVFAPSADQMYPHEPTITVDPGPAGRVLEGAFRPGFFTGVLTVVLKLFNLVRPDLAVFGEKDAQQVFLVRRMVAELNLGVDIVAVPTVREPDGLAASSRNGYLSAADRVTALSLSRALLAGSAAANLGQQAVLAAAEAELAKASSADPPLVLDYLELVDASTFGAVAAGHSGPTTLLVAATVGKTRLIDNTQVILAGPS